MALVVRDNTPSPGFISWTGLHIVYKGVDYTIQDGNTNKRFVYWKPSVSTTILQTSDTLPELGDDDLLVFLNKNGIHVTVPTSTVVEGSLIVEESILTNALAANAVTAEKIASGAIEARHLAAESVTADAIAAGAIGAGAIAAGAILSEAIASGQVLADHIAAGQIQSNHIAANQIQANHITSGAITADKIASNAVTAAKIAAGAVTVDKIAIFGSSRVDELYVRGTGYNNPANRQVRLGNTFLVNGGGRGFCLTVIKRSDHSHLSYRRDGTPSSTLAASQVYDVYDKDEDRLALRNALIELRTNANGTRANGEWGSDIIIIITSYDSWRTDLAYGDELVDELLNHGASEAIRRWGLIRTPYLLIGIPGIGEGRGIEILTDNDPTAPWAEYSGLLINGNLAGLGGLLPGSVSATIIQDGAVTADKIAANAITADKIASNAITADKITSNAVTAAKIASNAVTAAKIAAGAVTADKIASNAVTAAKIAAGAVTADKLAVGQLSAISADLGDVTAGVLRSPDNGLVVDANNRLITIRDQQSSPVTRVRLGKLGSNTTDYGIEIYNAAGQLVFSRDGQLTEVVDVPKRAQILEVMNGQVWSYAAYGSTPPLVAYIGGGVCWDSRARWSSDLNRTYDNGGVGTGTLPPVDSGPYAIVPRFYGEVLPNQKIKFHAYLMAISSQQNRSASFTSPTTIALGGRTGPATLPTSQLPAQGDQFFVNCTISVYMGTTTEPWDVSLNIVVEVSTNGGSTWQSVASVWHTVFGTGSFVQEPITIGFSSRLTSQALVRLVFRERLSTSPSAYAEVHANTVTWNQITARYASATPTTADRARFLILAQR